MVGIFCWVEFSLGRLRSPDCKAAKDWDFIQSLHVGPMKDLQKREDCISPNLRNAAGIAVNQNGEGETKRNVSRQVLRCLCLQRSQVGQLMWTHMRKVCASGWAHGAAPHPFHKWGTIKWTLSHMHFCPDGADPAYNNAKLHAPFCYIPYLLTLIWFR